MTSAEAYPNCIGLIWTIASRRGIDPTHPSPVGLRSIDVSSGELKILRSLLSLPGSGYEVYRVILPDTGFAVSVAAL